MLDTYCMFMKVAIIGSGPAGLACANVLFDNGFKVEIFEELKVFGGMPAYAIPDYRIHSSSTEKRIMEMKAKGISFIQKKIINIKKLSEENDIVVIAIGAGKGNKTGIFGENNNGIIDGIEFLTQKKMFRKELIKSGENIAVVGGGNASLDAAILAKKIGAEVSVLYRRTEKEMPAFGNEIQTAKNLGVKFEFLVNPSEYLEDKKENKIIAVCAMMALSGKDESGRAKPYDTGKRKKLSFDKVILAFGQRNDMQWLESEGIKTDGKNIIVNETFETSLKKVFACGDCITGAKDIANAVVSGTNCAKQIISIIKK
jgi:NADPH-dependent glutamate synthase beta subunit-like oxidoreductase